MEKASKNYTPRICDLAEDDKPREKAQKHGITTLSDAELLAIIFGSGLRGKSVISLSQENLSDIHNRLDKLAKMTISELSSKYSGIGLAKATSLAASIELGRRCQRALESEGQKDPKIQSSKDVYNIMRTKLENLTHEQFWILHLSRASKVTSMDCISTGGTAATLVDVKIVIKSAIDKLSSSLILVHNHPSGNITPSSADKVLTSKIKSAAELLEIKVLDHIIVGQGNYFSFMDEGLM